MRTAVFGLQSDLYRHHLDVIGREPASRDIFADTQDILLADVEVHMDRVMLNDRGEHRRMAR